MLVFAVIAWGSNDLFVILFTYRLLCTAVDDPNGSVKFLQNKKEIGRPPTINRLMVFTLCMPFVPSTSHQKDKHRT
jgi:hypothetical protein